jgi:bis(5'-nucleosyl)-tetraphosphatase (symmetrical)
MAHYVVGDVQGCFKELEALLKKIKFNFNKDILIFAGDLVNRGDASEKVLEFCIKNKESVKAVLGNHDFYLLYLIEHQKKDKSLKKVLESKNVKKYQALLKKQPLLLDIKIKESNEIFWISHAGIPFIWQANKAKKFSKEIQVALKNDSSNLLKNIWGDTPKISNWCSFEEVKNSELATCITKGHLLSQSKGITRIFGDYSLSDDKKKIETIGNTTLIPNSVIKDIKKI